MLVLDADGEPVGASVGCTVGAAVGIDVGAAVGTAVGVKVGAALGTKVGLDPLGDKLRLPSLPYPSTSCPSSLVSPPSGAHRHLW